MKKLSLMFSLLASIFLLSISTSYGVPEDIVDAEMKKIRIKATITAQNGCVFEVNGWIDVGWGLNGWVVNGYDLTASGPCGTFHFLSRIENPAGDGETEISDYELNDIIEDIINQNID